MNVEVQASRWRRITGSGEVQRLLAEARRHNRRAASWTPPGTAWPQPRWNPIFTAGCTCKARTASRRWRTVLPSSSVFWPTFPSRATHREVLIDCLNLCLEVGNPHETPNPLVPIDPQLRKALFRKGLEHYREFLLRYCMERDNFGRPDIGGYFENLSQYLECCQPSDAELQAMAQQWAKDFDGKTSLVPDSDSFRRRVEKFKQ